MDELEKAIKALRDRGATDDQIRAFVAQHQHLATDGPSDDQAPASAGKRSTLYNAVNTVDNALTFGLGQKFNAAFNAAGDAVRGRDSFGHSYTKNLEAEQSGLEDFRNAHPYGAATAGAVGGAAQALAAAPLLAAQTATPALSLAGRAAQAAKIGGATGAIAGLGNAPNDGGLSDQGLRALLGGGIGAGLGAAAVPLAEGAASLVGRAGRAANTALAADETSPAFTRVAGKAAGVASGRAPEGSLGPADDGVNRLLLSRMRRASLAPSDALGRLESMPSDLPVSLMETAGERSHPLRQLGKLVARTPSTGAADLRAAVADRNQPLANAKAVLGDVADALDVERKNLTQQGEALGQQRLAAAKPHYEAAEVGPPVPVSLQADEGGPTLADLLKRPSVKSAIAYHNDVAAERGEGPLALPSASKRGEADALAQQLIDAGVDPEKARAFADAQHPSDAVDAIPLKTLQQIKFKLDDMLGFAKTRGELPDGSAATRQRLDAINDTRRALLEIMGKHAPDYAKGNEVYAGQSALQNALSDGRELLSRDIGELQAAYPKLTPGEREQHNIGAVGGPLRDRIYKTDALERSKLFANPDIQERFAVVAEPSKLAELHRRTGIRHDIALTDRAITGGSDTAENALNQFDAGSSGLANEGMRALMKGGPTKAAARLAEVLAESKLAARMQGVNERTADALAPRLAAGMNGDRESLARVIQQLIDYEDQLRRIARPVAPAGAAIGGASGATTAEQSRRAPGPRGF